MSGNWGEEEEQKYMPCIQREGVGTSKYVHNKTPFCMYFVMFSYARYFCHTLLSLMMSFMSVL